MKVAILSDIHGNFTALDAVLRVATRERVELLLILGDCVGYYYDVVKVLERLEPWDSVMIRGNHEDMLARSRRSPAELASVTKKYGHGVSVALKNLDEAHLDLLEELPEQREVSLGGVRLLLSHGSPLDHNAYIYPDTDVQRLRDAVITEYDFVLTGHTHHAFASVVQGVTLLNPGSVGQPRDWGGAASWIILDTANKVFRFIRTRYEVKSVADQARQRDPSMKYLVDILYRNQDPGGADGT